MNQTHESSSATEPINMEGSIFLRRNMNVNVCSNTKKRFKEPARIRFESYSDDIFDKMILYAEEIYAKMVEMDSIIQPKR